MNTIVIAPFSNSDIRDWPASHFAALIGLLLRRWEGIIRVIGTRSQWTRACAIVRDHDPVRVRNDCGRIPWADVEQALRTAACVIGNNSGIAHLAGRSGAPTVCVFGGSHQRSEWHPLGPNVVVLSRVIGCSPCHLDHNNRCGFGKRCLYDLAPADVADAVFAAMAGARRPDIDEGEAA